MEKQFIFTGLGGQGVKLAGEILCYAASSIDGLYATNYALYGRQMRGGMSDCYVAISDEPINAPVFWQAEYVVAFTTETPENPAKKLKKGSVLFMNTPNKVTAEEYGAESFVKFNAHDIAAELGSPRSANIVIIGVVVGYSQALPEDVVLQTIFDKLGGKHPEFNDSNAKAFQAGVEIGKKARQAEKHKPE